MTTKLIGVDDANPELPAGVIAASASGIRGLLPEFNIRDFGALPGGTEVATQVQAAATAVGAAGGGTLLIPDGTWKVSTSVTIDASGVQLKLSPGAVIDATGLTTDANLFYFEGAVGTTTTATGSTISKYTRTLAVTSTTGFAVGDFIQMLSTQDWDITRGAGEYCQSEWNRITAIVSGTSMRLEKMVAYDWDNAGHPVNVQKIDGLRGVGVAGPGRLILGGTGQLQTAVRFIYCIDSFANDLTIEYSENVGISFQRCYGFKATRNTVMHTDDETTGYGIMSQGSEAGLIALNIGMFNRRSFEANGGENGISRNVTIDNNIAYSDRTTGCGSHAGTDFITISNNHIEGCGGGVISRGAHGEVRDNTIINSIDTSTGFPVTGDISYLDGITVGSEGVGVFLAQIGECVAGIEPRVIGNKVYGPNRYAIFLRGCDFIDAQVEDNTVEGRIAFGQTSGEFLATRCSVSDNKVVAKTSTGTRDTFGIVIAHKHIDLWVERNIVRFAGTTGIIVIGSTDVGSPNDGLHYRGNKVYDCTTRGHDLATGFWGPGSFVIDNYAQDCPTPFRGAPSYAAHVRPVAFGNYSDNPTTVGGFFGWGTAAPTASTYVVGAIVWNSAPSIGAPSFWRCTTAGTPGTWEAVGASGFGSVNGSTSATLTLSALDLNRALMPARATAQSFVIPPASTLGAWPLGLPRSVIQAGAGQITFSGGAGVTVSSKGGALKSNGQGSQMWITYAGSDVWWLTGDITT